MPSWFSSSHGKPTMASMCMSTLYPALSAREDKNFVACFDRFFKRTVQNRVVCAFFQGPKIRAGDFFCAGGGPMGGAVQTTPPPVPARVIACPCPSQELADAKALLVQRWHARESHDLLRSGTLPLALGPRSCRRAAHQEVPIGFLHSVCLFPQGGCRDGKLVRLREIRAPHRVQVCTLSLLLLSSTLN